MGVLSLTRTYAMHTTEACVHNISIKSNIADKMSVRGTTCNVYKQVRNVLWYVFVWYCVCALDMYRPPRKGTHYVCLRYVLPKKKIGRML